MRNRGKIYWDWADPTLHVRSKDERLPDGTLLNVLVRMSSEGAVQLFVGVYGVKGMMLFEESYDSRPGETMTKAVEWGLERARQQAPSVAADSVKVVKPEKLPRAGSRQSK